MVLNDEAHHTHDEGSEWNNIIKNLHGLKPLSMQLIFSALPYSKGALFHWIISDYPLKQAILDGIVKRPVKGISKINEERTNVTHKRYAGFLTAGIERWREYKKQLADLNKKPILFLMLNDTDEADDVGEWIRTKYPDEFGGEKTLIIHTDKSGEIPRRLWILPENGSGC